MNMFQDRKSENDVFGTKEWAHHNENCVVGCSHDCKYCYAKSMAARFKRVSANEWKNETLRGNYFNRKFPKRNGIIMFPSSHDVSPKHLSECITFASNMLSAGNKVLIVSKPHLNCIKAICQACLKYKDQLLFRFTIGSVYSDILNFWEPGASSFHERLDSLKFAYKSGFETSVSCEPMLDDQVHQIIEAVQPYITDSIWIGKPNNLIGRLKINGFGNDSETMNKAQSLLTDLDNGFIRSLHSMHKDNPLIRWKDSIRKVLQHTTGNSNSQKGE